MPMRREDVADIPKAHVREREHRYIYSGTPARNAVGYAIRPNRKGIRRKVSTFNLILLLMCIGGAIVFYINNIITINTLAYDVNQLQAKYEQVLSQNEALRAEINRKSSWERISVLAGEKLGLKPPHRPPDWINIDRDKLNELQSHTRETQ
jgi:cell division protein FtsB